MGKKFIFPILTVTIIFAILLKIENRVTRSNIQNTISAILSLRGYQGVILDTGGVGTLLYQNTLNIKSIKINQIELRSSLNIPKYSRELSNECSIFCYSLHLPFEEDTLNITYSLSESILFILCFISLICTALLWFFKKSYLNYQYYLKERELSQERFLMAREVCHDLRSPLDALQIIAEINKEHKSKETQLLLNSIDRIQNISQNLLQSSKNDLSNFDNEFNIKLFFKKNHKLENNIKYSVIEILHRIIEEKNSFIQTKIEFDDTTTETAFIKMSVQQKINFERAISNLIQNAVEANSMSSIQSPSVKVIIMESKHKESFTIKITDQGPGFPDNILEQINSKKRTLTLKTSKKDGNGLGLLQAKKAIVEIGGLFYVESHQNLGSMIIITLNQ